MSSKNKIKKEINETISKHVNIWKLDEQLKNGKK